ncbi:hypothetical protein D9C73_020128 [Collichthys lucidus]|uniref:Uncharacterized protein n=1 Tax=Collichthys lucidus TaxID=240159 RepID=A0A4U5VEC7_COLLU|nr:hypothetical protein D9C73_020128 [Collichthys lucidus]
MAHQLQRTPPVPTCSLSSAALRISRSSGRSGRDGSPTWRHERSGLEKDSTCYGMEAMDHQKQQQLGSTALGLSKQLKVDLPPEETTTATININHLLISMEKNSEGQPPPKKSEDQEEGEKTDEVEEEIDQCPPDPDVPPLKRTESVFEVPEDSSLSGGEDEDEDVMSSLSSNSSGLRPVKKTRSVDCTPTEEDQESDASSQLTRGTSRTWTESDTSSQPSKGGSSHVKTKPIKRSHAEEDQESDASSQPSKGLRPVKKTRPVDCTPTEEDQESDASSQLSRGGSSHVKTKPIKRSHAEEDQESDASSQPRKGGSSPVKKTKPIKRSHAEEDQESDASSQPSKGI